jgi:hypothetical protein
MNEEEYKKQKDLFKYHNEPHLEKDFEDDIPELRFYDYYGYELYIKGNIVEFYNDRLEEESCKMEFNEFYQLLIKYKKIWESRRIENF